MANSGQMVEAHWPVDVLHLASKRVIKSNIEKLSTSNIQFRLPEAVTKGELFMLRINYRNAGEQRPILLKGKTCQTIFSGDSNNFIAVMDVDQISKDDLSILQRYIDTRKLIREKVSKLM